MTIDIEALRAMCERYVASHESRGPAMWQLAFDLADAMPSVLDALECARGRLESVTNPPGLIGDDWDTDMCQAILDMGAKMVAAPALREALRAFQQASAERDSLRAALEEERRATEHLEQCQYETACALVDAGVLFIPDLSPCAPQEVGGLVRALLVRADSLRAALEAARTCHVCHAYTGERDDLRAKLEAARAEVARLSAEGVSEYLQAICDERDSLRAALEACRRGREAAEDDRDLYREKVSALLIRMNAASVEVANQHLDLEQKPLRADWLLAEADSLRAKLEAAERDRDAIAAHSKRVQTALYEVKAKLEAAEKREAALRGLLESVEHDLSALAAGVDTRRRETLADIAAEWRDRIAAALEVKP
jgi:DNA repair exonuclease SbcCD ATPase subunit